MGDAPAAQGAALLLDDARATSSAASSAQPMSPLERKKAFAKRQLRTIMAICVLFMTCEVVGGYFAGSLAIMTDAAHLLSDAASFAISLGAVWLAERPRTAHATFGFHRVEIFGALASVLLIWVLTAVLCFEAVERIRNPEPVKGDIMFITAALGLGVNLAMMRVLHGGGGGDEGGGGGGGSHHGHSHAGGHGHSHGGSGDNMAVQAAFIHILGDFVQSIGVLIAAAVIWAVPEAHIADPICTFIFSVLVLFTTFNILRSAYHELMNGVPAHVDLARLAADMMTLPAVTNVHDLHVWSFGQDRLCLTAHIIVSGTEHDRAAALEAASALAAKLGIRHSTLQVELASSTDVASCLRFNEHVDECALTLQDPDSPRPSLFLVERPGGSDGAAAGRRLALLSPPASHRVAECSGDDGDHSGYAHAHAGHWHAHPSSGHGHAHASAHGHAHGHAHR